MQRVGIRRVWLRSRSAAAAAMAGSTPLRRVVFDRRRSRQSGAGHRRRGWHRQHGGQVIVDQAGHHRGGGWQHRRHPGPVDRRRWRPGRPERHGGLQRLPRPRARQPSGSAWAARRHGADAGSVQLTSQGNIAVNAIHPVRKRPRPIRVSRTSSPRWADRDARYPVGPRRASWRSRSVAAAVSGASTAGWRLANKSVVSMGIGGSAVRRAMAARSRYCAAIRWRRTERSPMRPACWPPTAAMRLSGLVAQSIGGGGGLAESICRSPRPRRTKTLRPIEPSPRRSPSGGSGGAAGDGDAVTVRHNGTIVTNGERSDAIVAQSIGGGGGKRQLLDQCGYFSKATAGSRSRSAAIRARAAIAATLSVRQPERHDPGHRHRCGGHQSAIDRRWWRQTRPRPQRWPSAPVTS